MRSKTVTKRRFEFVENGSDKFWEAEVDDVIVTVRYGRNGTQGQVNVKTFPSAAAASAHAEKQIQSKLAKGYVEIS